MDPQVPSPSGHYCIPNAPQLVEQREPASQVIAWSQLGYLSHWEPSLPERIFHYTEVVQSTTMQLIHNKQHSSSSLQLSHVWLLTCGGGARAREEANPDPPILPPLCAAMASPDGTDRMMAPAKRIAEAPCTAVSTGVFNGLVRKRGNCIGKRTVWHHAMKCSIAGKAGHNVWTGTAVQLAVQRTFACLCLEL